MLYLEFCSSIISLTTPCLNSATNYFGPCFACLMLLLDLFDSLTVELNYLLLVKVLLARIPFYRGQATANVARQSNNEVMRKLLQFPIPSFLLLDFVSSKK